MAEGGFRRLIIFRFQYYTCNISLSTYLKKKMQLGGLQLKSGDRLNLVSHTHVTPLLINPIHNS
jgi:hypothetical protein